MKPNFLATVLLVLLLLVSPMALAQRRHHRAPRSHSKSGVAALQTKLGNLRRKKQALQHQLHANKALTHQTLQEIAQVDQQLTDVENALQVTSQQLSDSRVKQTKVAGELQQATDKLTVVKAEVRARLRRIYSDGPTSSLSVLLGSHTGGELAARGEMLAQIAQSDRKVFNQYKALRSEVADRKHAADALVVQVSSLEQRQQAEQDELQQTRTRKSEKVKELEQQAGELEEAIAQFQQDEAELSSELERFSHSAVGESLPPFAGGFIRPVPGAITSGFGYRYHPILHITRLHAGVDFHAPTGTPVHAAASGVIVRAQYMRGYGNTITIAHGSDIATVYGHLSRIMVSNGERVTQGQVIGLSGATGLATGPHLHFEIRVHNNPVNPIGFKRGIR